MLGFVLKIYQSTELTSKSSFLTYMTAAKRKPKCVKPLKNQHSQAFYVLNHRTHRSKLLLLVTGYWLHYLITHSTKTETVNSSYPHRDVPILRNRHLQGIGILPTPTLSPKQAQKRSHSRYYDLSWINHYLCRFIISITRLWYSASSSSAS